MQKVLLKAVLIAETFVNLKKKKVYFIEICRSGQDYHILSLVYGDLPELTQAGCLQFGLRTLSK